MAKPSQRPWKLDIVSRRYAEFFGLTDHWFSAAAAILVFAASIYANYMASAYATVAASNSVTDLILDHTAVFDVDGYFVYGAVALIAFILLLLLLRPKRITFTLHSLALFFFIRAGFITLTHIGPYPVHTAIQFTSSIGIFLSKVFFGDDLFFSGHTGAPFLMALVYWREHWLRYIFLAWSVFLAGVVLLGHIHYSIDVASAFFITFTIYHIALWLFPQEHAAFLKDEARHPIEVAGN
ncbi:MAG: conserved rane protein of unknown function [Candidatus Kaiserbacteria bacterium]|nr:conserved rane protein of unknown function [Candidatus Kaiserbacteria bacterium]